MKKKYKAILFDIDGTLVPHPTIKDTNEVTNTLDLVRQIIPSNKVKDALQKASNNIHVGFATSRPLFMIEHLFKHISFSCPSILNGGTQIFDPLEKIILWEKILSKNSLKKISKILRDFTEPYIIFDDGENYYSINKYKPKKPFTVWLHGFNSSIIKKHLNNFTDIPGIEICLIPSWKKEKIDIYITHKYATKKHAINKIATMLKIKTSEIIGVGDGYNDIPLLSSCGLKIAMGNAVPELKAIADYIAPPVEKDGVADIIEKFALNPSSG